MTEIKIADQETLLSVKTTANSIKTTTSGIQTKAKSIEEKTDSVLLKLEAVGGSQYAINSEINVISGNIGATSTGLPIAGFVEAANEAVSGINASLGKLPEGSELTSVADAVQKIYEKVSGMGSYLKIQAENDFTAETLPNGFWGGRLLMPKIQVNDNGVARTLKKIQANDGGVIRTLKKIQVNGNGVIKTIFLGTNISVGYTGGAITEVKNSSQGYAILTTSGTFTFPEDVPETADLYLVGRGADCSDLNGGAGGYIQKHLGIALPKTFAATLPTEGSLVHVSLSVGGYTSSGGTSAAAGAVNPLTDFWGRNWAGGGGVRASSGNGDGGSNGAAGQGSGNATNKGGGGGSSPIGGGGASYLAQGGSPNGGAGGTSRGSKAPDAYGGGGAGGTWLSSSGTTRGEAFGGGGRGGVSSGTSTASGGGLGGGGAGACVADSKDTTNGAAHGGGGVIIIRWGDCPL